MRSLGWGVGLWLASTAAHALDFTPEGTQPGLVHTLEPSSECSTCHGGSGNAARYMPWPTWSGTLMANAGRDPLFWAALDVANHDVPGVGDFCLRCHSPSGWYGGRVVKTAEPGVTVQGHQGCLLQGDHDDPDGYGHDYGGIGCHFCHRVRPAGPQGQTLRQHNGNLWLDDSDCDTNHDGVPDYFGPCRAGPYRYPSSGIVGPPHAHQHSDYVQRSELCGNCHDVTTPITDQGPYQTLILPDGSDSGLPFPIERTYSEWAASDFGDALHRDGFAYDEPAGKQARYGSTCQSCHMPQTPDPSARACFTADPGTRAGDLAIHEFAGANAWMPSVLASAYPGLGRSTAYTQTRQAAIAMLARAATVQVTAGAVADQVWPLQVRVDNLAGHKLPTGYGEGRRMWLELVVRDANGVVIWTSNRYNSTTATLDIDRDDAVYEVLQGIYDPDTGQCSTTDSGGQPHFHFVRNNCVAKDNRIPPQGFRGGEHLELRAMPPQRYPRVAPGADRWAHWDVQHYAVPVPPGTPLPLSARAELRHQVATRDYLEFLRDQAVTHAFPSENALCAPHRPPLPTGPRTLSRGAFAFQLWEQNGRAAPQLIAAGTATSP